MLPSVAQQFDPDPPLGALTPEIVNMPAGEMVDTTPLFDSAACVDTKKF
jgi:hypothetical protein